MDPTTTGIRSGSPELMPSDAANVAEGSKRIDQGITHSSEEFFPEALELQQQRRSEDLRLKQQLTDYLCCSSSKTPPALVEL